jgi:hypothetical protein
LCEQLIVPYNNSTRTAEGSLPINVSDIDLSAYDLCQDIPVAGQACVGTVSFNGTVGYDVVWAGDYKTFDGTLTVGSVGTPASATVTITGAGAGTYNVTFYGTWDLSGVRCTSCTPCS